MSAALSNSEWIATLTTGQVEAGISKAIREHDWQAVEGLLLILAVKDPQRARTVYDALCIATAPRAGEH